MIVRPPYSNAFTDYSHRESENAAGVSLERRGFQHALRAFRRALAARGAEAFSNVGSPCQRGNHLSSSLQFSLCRWLQPRTAFQMFPSHAEVHLRRRFRAQPMFRIVLSRDHLLSSKRSELVRVCPNTILIMKGNFKQGWPYRVATSLPPPFPTNTHKAKKNKEKKYTLASVMIGDSPETSHSPG